MLVQGLLSSLLWAAILTGVVSVDVKPVFGLVSVFNHLCPEIVRPCDIVCALRNGESGSERVGEEDGQQKA